MKISRYSFVYKVANNFCHPDDNLCSLARCFFVSCSIFLVMGGLSLAFIAALFIVSGSSLGEVIASLVTGYYDEQSIFRFVFFFLLYTVYALAATLYYTETRNIPLIENMVKFFEEDEKKEQNVYWEMLKSFTGKFCVRVEYTYDKE